MPTYELAVIPLTSIDLGQRFREDYGDIEQLGKSFDISDGMIQTLMVKRNPDNPERYTLVAGGRRYMAALLRKDPEVPARIMPDTMDSLTLRLLELLENVCRKDFEWKEKVALEAEIHSLRKSKDPTWRQGDTARLLGITDSAMTESLQMNKVLKEEPVAPLVEAKNMNDARKVLSKIKRDKQREKMVTIALATKSAEPKNLLHLGGRFIVADALVGMKALQSESFDLVEIDPPYGIDYSERASAGTTATYTEVKDQDYDTFINTVITEAYRVAKPNSFCVLWLPIQRYVRNLQLCTAAGWKPATCPLVWTKPGAGLASSLTLRLANSYELALYMHKGNPKLPVMGHTDTFVYPTTSLSQRIHPTERPLELMKELYTVFANPGAMILSPFLGSGVSIYAASCLNQTCIGFDLSETHKTNFLAKVTAGWSTYRVKDHKNECILLDESTEGNPN